MSGAAPTGAPTVSIVIPAYNADRYLAEAIESVLAQVYPDLELIVIDDGSTDGTASVLEEYAGRLRFERQANSGQAAALNRGWEMARGAILGYLSADDVLYPGAVTAAVAALGDDQPTVMVYPDFDLIGPDSLVIRRVRAKERSLEQMLRRFECLPGPGAFFRRTALERAGGWDPRLSQLPDLEFWLRLALVGPFRRIPRRLAAFRVHPGSATFGPVSSERAEEPVAVIERLQGCGYFDRFPVWVARQAAAAAQVAAARYHLCSGRAAAALRSLWRAGRLDPLTAVRPRSLHLLAHGVFSRAVHRARWGLARRRHGRPGGDR